MCSCFASPHKRARQTAEIVWEERGQQLGPPLYLDTLREANLGWFQGLKNGECLSWQGPATDELCCHGQTRLFCGQPISWCEDLLFVSRYKCWTHG